MKNEEKGYAEKVEAAAQKAEAASKNRYGGPSFTRKRLDYHLSTKSLEPKKTFGDGIIIIKRGVTHCQTRKRRYLNVSKNWRSSEQSICRCQENR